MSIQQITVIGLGNIGGSIGLAVRDKKVSGVTVTGYVRRGEAGREALRRGVVDRVSNDLGEAVSSADLVVLAIPVAAMKSVLQQINPHLKAGAVVLDVGSTKVDVSAWGQHYIGPAATFVGGHPMAGSAAAGIAGADGELFKDTVFCVVPGPDSPRTACQAVEQLLKWVGARPLQMSASNHDLCVATVSHLPMLLASVLATTAISDPRWDAASQLAAQGFREMTRMAAGSAEVRRSICSTNRQAVADAIDSFIDTLQDYRQHILHDDDELLTLFEDARSARASWVAARYPR